MSYSRLWLRGQRKETAARFVGILEREAKLILADYAEEADRRGVKAETMLAKGHPAKIILYTARTTLKRQTW